MQEFTYKDFENRLFSNSKSDLAFNFFTLCSILAKCVLRVIQVVSKF